MKTRIIGNEMEIRMGDGKLIRTPSGWWDHDRHPFKKPILHLRDARRAFKDQNRPIEAATDESEAIKNTYEIGGTCVTMTADQAAAWNRGNITREICEGAYVSVPCRSGTTSYVRDGEVVVEDGNPYEEFIPLWDYIGGDDGESAEYTNDMEGNSANLVREGR